MRCVARPMAFILLSLLARLPVLASDPSTPGALSVTVPDGTTIDMPLRHTKVSIEVTAFVVRTTVEQVFNNPFDTPVEAVYTFPLGDRAAVDDFELTVGDRTIHGEIQRRDEAQRTYATARAAGYQAALLEQERPNIFTQSVANLAPGKSVTVRLRTFETARYERGSYRIAFPLVVAPRYGSGGVAGVAGTAALGSPGVPFGKRSGHDIEIDVTIDAGTPLGALQSVSHRIVIQRNGGTAAHVQLAQDDTIPNKDFQLQWSVASERPALGLLAHRDGVDGYFTLLVQPKAEVSQAEAAPKEITFVVDTSGSMSGIPLDASKRFIAAALHEMGPRDTFNVIRFSGDNEVFSKDPLPNVPAEVDRAIAWVNAQDAGGGTEMLAALKAAFARPIDPNRLRIVVFLTDGEVGDDDEILATIGSILGEARIYTVGIGSSVNRYLLDRMADIGRGAFVAVRPDEHADDALEAFRSWVTHPYLTDLTVDWGALPVVDVSPDPIRDLGSGQTLTLVGRYLNGATDDVVVRGKLGGHYWEQRLHVVLPDAESRHGALASLWARGRVENLLLASAGGVSDSIRAEVTSLALDYRLMSPFTSFVAVDDSTIVNAAGTAPIVRQAVPLPEGVSFAGIFGASGPQAFALSGDDREPEDMGVEESGVDTPAVPAPPPASPPTPLGSALATGGLRIRVIDGSDNTPVIGAAVTISSMSKLVATSTNLTDVKGVAFYPVLPAGPGYVVTVIMDCYAGIRQEVTVTNGQSKDLAVALAPEHVEKIIVTGEKTSVDVDKNQTATSFSSDSVADLPVAGRFYQNVLSLVPGVQDPLGDGNPNVNGARERDFKTQVSGVSNVDPLTGTFLNLVTQDSIEDLTVITAGAGAEFGRAQGGFAEIVQAQGHTSAGADSDLAVSGKFYQNTLALAPGMADSSADDEPEPHPGEVRTRLREAAFRVLADLADDGRLSPAEGKPALVALLAAQIADGAIADDVTTHAIATWALAEAARAMPKDPWVDAARDKAVDYLVSLATPEGWPKRPGAKPSTEATLWARFVLGLVHSGSTTAVATPLGNASKEFTRLTEAIAAAKKKGKAHHAAGRDAFDRLLATIGRRHLMV